MTGGVRRPWLQHGYQSHSISIFLFVSKYRSVLSITENGVKIRILGTCISIEVLPNFSSSSLILGINLGYGRLAVDRTMVMRSPKRSGTIEDTVGCGKG